MSFTFCITAQSTLCTFLEEGKQPLKMKEAKKESLLNEERSFLINEFIPHPRHHAGQPLIQLPSVLYEPDILLYHGHADDLSPSNVQSQEE